MDTPLRNLHSEAVFKIGGMTCPNCALHVREAIEATDGIAGVRVDLSAQTAFVQWTHSGLQNKASVIEAVRAAGYEAAPVAKKRGNWPASVVFAGAAFVFFMLSEWVLGWHQQSGFRWLAFAVALPVQVFCGSRFYAGAWRQLKSGRSNMDTLVSLGSTAAFAYSVSALFLGLAQPLYFMESVGIIAFVSFGHFIESRVAGKAAGAVESLFSLAPDQAKRLCEDGAIETVDAASLCPGQRIQIAPGERIAVDGNILQGASTCDESMLTGESLPVEKSTRQPVYAGTLNLSSLLTVEVTGAGKDTALARIIGVVERAQNSRAEVQKLADRISGIFVPIVVCIALGTLLAWLLLPETTDAIHVWFSNYLWSTAIPASALAAGAIHSAAVLIVACPCAMGLATPIAIMAGTNAAANHGILIRDGKALERSGTITRILFDKTGTLTQGRPEVAAVETIPAGQPNAPALSDWASVLLALAAPSQHPLSQAIGKHLGNTEPGIAWSVWKEIPGKGVEATRTSPDSKTEETFRLGSLRWLVELGTDIGPVKDFACKQAETGATVIALAGPEGIAAAIALRDRIQPGAATVLRVLKKMRLSISLVSGDQRQTTAAVADTLGIASAHAEISPERKADLIAALQRQGEKVCFVGDGINDAPALEQADLGIAVCAAADLAKESADIILLRSDIQAIPQALALARATLRAIKQNLFWAFFYNAAGVPLAALGFLSPLLCAVAMGVSDLVVVGNALRLRFRRWRVAARQDAVGKSAL